MKQQIAPGFGTRRRDQLFDELVALFLSSGFAHLTLDRISAELRCSKSTLYALADSKGDLVRAATVHFFRGATVQVEAEIASVAGARSRVTTYLSAVGTALSAASDAFMEDLDAFPPARDVYEQNTRAATERVHQLIREGLDAGEFRPVHAAFAADLAATVIVRIQQGGVRRSSGLDDSEAYTELAAILMSGICA